MILPAFLSDRLAGCLVGMAIGDALGLPGEGLSRERLQRLFPKTEEYQFLFQWGLCSDDTEHACMTAQALISARGDVNRFAQKLAWKLRFWLLGLPAGVGMTTLKACLRLWLGIPPQQSGVFSAGNGPAMRAAILGVLYFEQPEVLLHFVKASTRMTHTDPRAEYGALAIALAAGMAARQEQVDPEAYYQCLRNHCLEPDSDFIVLMKKTVLSVQRKESIHEFLTRLGCAEGVSGFMLHTVPAVIHVWLTHQQNYRRALKNMIRCGGDTDTTAAILGGIMGGHVGFAALPRDLLQGLLEWPRSVRWMCKVAERLAQVHQEQALENEVFLNLPGLLLRNLFFIVIVLVHGFRRLLPPY